MNTPIYKSDADISSEFYGLTIDNIEKTLHGGYITCTAPNAGEHVAGGAYTFTDHYIDYDGNGKRIAFDNWYPEPVYLALCEAIRKA